MAKSDVYRERKGQDMPRRGEIPPREVNGDSRHCEIVRTAPEALFGARCGGNRQQQADRVSYMQFGAENGEQRRAA